MSVVDFLYLIRCKIIDVRIATLKIKSAVVYKNLVRLHQHLSNRINGDAVGEFQ